MSRPSFTPSEGGKTRYKRKFDALTEDTSAQRPENEKDAQLRAKPEASGSKRIKLSARDLLATLSRRRILISELKVFGDRSQFGGTYANVAVATLMRTGSSREEEREVAVKKLRFMINGDMSEEKFLRVFANELHVLDKLSHPNIVEIIGFVEDIENRIAWLVFPWEANGNLREFLLSEDWDIPERVSLIQDVACGIEYLHTRQPPICHGDLKSLNILVNSSNRAVITDFGSARILRDVQEARVDIAPFTATPGPSSNHRPIYDDNPQINGTASDTTLTLTGPAYSFRWAPPEVLNGAPPDLTSDIWAMGWIAWEVFTNSFPFQDLEREPLVAMRIIEGQLPPIDGQDQLLQVRRLWDLMLRCWKSDPKDRPSATEYGDALRWIPFAIPVTKKGGEPGIRSAGLLLKSGEIHFFGHRHEEAINLYNQGLIVAQSGGDKPVLGALLLELGEVYRAQSKHAKAEESYTQALDLFMSIGNHEGWARALFGLGYIYQAQSKDAKAEECFVQALHIFTILGNPFNQADTLNGLGFLLSRHSRISEAEELYSRALEISSSIVNHRGPVHASDGQLPALQGRAFALSGQARALHGLGQILWMRSNYPEAEKKFAEASDIFTSIGDESGRAIVLRSLGTTHYKQSKYTEAEEAYTQAMAIFRSVGDVRGQANTSHGLGDVYLARSEYSSAEESFAQALSIFVGIGDSEYQAEVLRGLGNVQLAQLKCLEAMDPNATIPQNFRSLGDDGREEGPSRGLGNGPMTRSKDARMVQSKYAEAEDSYTRALEIFAAIGDEKGQVRSSFGLGEIRLLQARYADAWTLIDEAGKTSERIDYEWGIDTSVDLLEEVAEAAPLSFLLTLSDASIQDSPSP